MKGVRYLLTAVLAIIVMIACQKELNFDSSGVSAGSLKSASTGDCLPSIVMGNYQKDSLLTNSNYIDVHVNITIPGTFEVKSDTVNGYSFFKAGTLGNTGDNIVRLYATGTPLAAGTDIFTIKYGTSVCTVAVTVTGPGGSGGGGAVYTFSSTSGNCTGALANGTYVAGTALTAANTLTVTVNVTTVGTFTIGAVPVDGFAFGASGTFTTTGIQTVTLNSTGTPTTAGSFNFSVTNGTNFCLIPITVTGAGPVASFTLGGAPSTCTGAVANGTYITGIPLTAANTVVLNVNVTTVGAYTVTTTSVNGMQFSATGTFSTTGAQAITLTGSGTPVSAGNNNFPATGSGSTCTFSIATTGAVSAAVYTLSGAPGTCSGATVNGTYTTGTTLTSANTVTLIATVTTAGAYTINTTSVNGIQFSGTGSFSGTGAQTVILTGTGTPIAAGSNNYPATGNASTCTFSVSSVAATVNTDYFPLTQNSWWSYDSDYTTPDSLVKRSGSQQTVGGNTYRIFSLISNVTQFDSTLYRKSGNDYYNRISVDSFTSIYFDVQQYGEILFLKENATAGTTWTSTAFSGTAAGTPLLIRYNFTLTSVNGTLTINGVTYNNVTKVDWKSQESADGGTTYTDDLGMESWYAKGIGLIKFHLYSIATPTNQYADNLRFYHVF